MTGDKGRIALSDSKDRMQRIRVGLTGLAVVFVIVLVTTAFLTRYSPSQPENATAAEQRGDEPLADLGVAPSAPELVNEANATAPLPAAALPATQP